MLQTELLLRTPIDVSLMRPYWYDSDEENIGTEYDTDSEPGSPRSVVTWTTDVAMEEIQEYLENKLIDNEDMSTETTVLGTWFEMNDNIYMSLKLNVKAYLSCGALHTKYFGYIHDTWEQERPYDIIKVVRKCEDGFVEYNGVLKTYWLRLIQRHWKNRAAHNVGLSKTTGSLRPGLRGLLSMYNRRDLSSRPDFCSYNILHNETPSAPK